MGEPDPRLARSDALTALGGRTFDLLVIGGGIIGAGVAAHAARAGLSVALVDRGDFGGATSSASSKLVHGGLRYLRLGDVRLVREAHLERRVLSTVVAPHLVHRLPFLLPLYESGPYRPAFVQSGILLYSALAQSRLNWLVSPGRARGMVPPLELRGLRSCALYADAWTNDARLCLGNVRAASEAGAAVVNRAEVVAIRSLGGRVCGAELHCEGQTIAVGARVVVNAAGPWVDHVRRMEEPRAGRSVRLSKGVHAVVPRADEWAAALTIVQDPVRVTFAVPWYGMLLLGTTDAEYEGDPGTVAVEPDDIEQILADAARALAPDTLAPPDGVLATWAGLRVLPAGPGESVSARRETVYSFGPGGMLSVAGGKLTTYRRIALGVLERLRGELGLRRVDRRPFPLPGASGLDDVRLPVEVDPSVRANLLHLYGALAAEVLEPAAEDRSLLERLHPDGPDIMAQVSYAARREWASRVEDVLLRRTTVATRGLGTPELEERVAAELERVGAGV
ncbi:MAG: glycerol-3-phosphate dehydrogenase/oxidase [Thermoleophilia bacterium]|nr:glycerol-3-phosphate dehydrogenase/oxidase [Thermoleophilia bacterium]MDH4344881.1 glycerol-3-phosphate dehydrogenase/oxidase [Thermoleophilia bacterium]MDH5333329.1 glycerol-3-phosphate dehydrogenase/oxidase [Thermoleophilia bacterium]